jgi:hypothetical protein
VRALAVALAGGVLAASAARAEPPVSARLELSAPEAFVNEQIVASLVVAHPPQVRPSWEAPNFEGFWSERLSTAGRAEGRDAAGEIRRVTAFRRALFASRPGLLEIAASRVLWQDEEGEEHVAAVPGARVRVRALPDGAPEGFGGVVGDLAIGVWVSHPEVGVGESARLVIDYHGTANGWDAPEPPLAATLGEQVEVFAERPTTTTGERDGLLSVRRTLRYDLVPRTPGEFAIPSLRVVVFDPAARRYRTVASEPVALRVLRERPHARSPFESRGYVPVPRPVPWLFLGIAVVAVGAFVATWLRRWSLASLRPLFGKPAPLPNVAFERAARALGRPEFGALLADAVRAGVHARHGFDPSALTTEEIAERGADTEAVRLLGELDRARFSGRVAHPETLLAEVRRHLGV